MAVFRLCAFAPGFLSLVAGTRTVSGPKIQCEPKTLSFFPVGYPADAISNCTSCPAPAVPNVFGSYIGFGISTRRGSIVLVVTGRFGQVASGTIARNPLPQYELAGESIHGDQRVYSRDFRRDLPFHQLRVVQWSDLRSFDFGWLV